MKKILTYLLLLFTTASYAQLQNGFYRIHNFATERYVYVYDNTGKINISTASADMGAIQLWKNHNRTISDPASIIYVEDKGGNMYNLHSQGTSVHEIIGYNVMVYPKGDTYQLYASNGSIGKYLADDETSNVPDGQLGTIAKGDYRKWVATPVNLEDNFFGIKPKFNIDNTYYKPFFADFAFSFANEGMKAYYVSETYKHIAVIKEIKDEIIAANTPVIIECKNGDASSNKLNLYINIGNSANNNLLKGIYFNNERRPKSKDARTKYDANTMRVLGITSDGKLGFITSKEEYLAANEAYLNVSVGSPEEFELMTEEQLAAYKESENDNGETGEGGDNGETGEGGDNGETGEGGDNGETGEGGDNGGSSIKNVNGLTKKLGVYSITGKKIADTINAKLPKGIYIVNGKKVIKL